MEVDTVGVEGIAGGPQGLDTEGVEIELEVGLEEDPMDRTRWSDILLTFHIEFGHSDPKTVRAVPRLFVVDTGNHRLLENESARRACRMYSVDRDQASSHCQMSDRLDTTWLFFKTSVCDWRSRVS